MRIGHGFDVHKFGADRPLLLAGVVVPHHTGLIAHSDGDVILHAVADALLGAAALGDIGQHFPDTDSDYKNADSSMLLKHVVELIPPTWRISNIDITVVAQAPKLAAFVPAMREHIASCLKVSVGQVNVKATTTEKLGYIGREEGIACHVVTLLENPDQGRDAT